MSKITTKQLYQRDALLIMAFICLAWLVIGFVLKQLFNIINSLILTETATLVGAATIVFMTSALIAVIVHLRKNSSQIYQ
ncbi:MAG: hypothetical protein Q8912_10630 [Bacillota bacterium]|nr:hypothetical protein [Bacillota bacterium]MDP4161118.1 hypothetical protein [Bacillota bacterium]